jgi:hypothetical protein
MMNFNPLTVAKYAVSAIVGLGTKKIVVNVIKNNVLPTSPIDKVTVTAAAWVISAMVTEATQEYTNDAIDGAAGFVTKIVDKIKTAQKLGRLDRKESTFEKEGLDPEDFVQDPITKKWSLISKDSVEDKLERINNGESTFVEEGLDPANFHRGMVDHWSVLQKPTD